MIGAVKDLLDSLRPGQTITAPSGPHPMPKDDERSASLPVVRVENEPAPSADFELGETIGVGGMGQVMSARQTALDRPVAAKFLRDPNGDPAALLREAIVTGRLEHPNIVPVHLLATTATGAPFFAMKRVEGTPWSEALEAGRSLVEHLEVLSRVCDAVAFAHDRGVLHRDIKPANVLLGRFGEVYLVDWGLAVSLAEDHVLPLASTAGFAGTPAYMAPEMAADEPSKLGVTTDVYLLGATLYEILEGKPPLLGLQQAEPSHPRANDPPLYSRPVPSELASICQRAMARLPQARFQSVFDFKEAITRFLQHREALELFDQARQRLTQLERATVIETSPATASLLGLEAHSLFTECRFAFEQVRRLWPEFEGAREGLQRALALMARHELARDDPRAARILLSQMNEKPAELVAAVEDAEARQRQRNARLSELERDARDREVDLALTGKRRFSIAFGLFVGLGSLAAQLAVNAGLFVPTTALAAMVFGAPLLSSELYSVIMSRSVQNRAQRQIAMGLRVSAWSSISLWLFAWWLDIPVRSAMTIYLVLTAANWSISSVLFNRQGIFVAVPIAIAAFGAALAPSWVFAIAGLGSAIGFCSLGWAMQERRVTPPS